MAEMFLFFFPSSVLVLRIHALIVHFHPICYLRKLKSIQMGVQETEYTTVE